MALEYRITLDMEKSDRSPEMVAARVGDKDSVKITASLTNNGSAYTPSGANAYFECVTTAGTSVRIPATKSGSSVSVNIPAAALVAPGVITCAYFRFENGPTNNPTLVESTQSFGIIVPDGIGDHIEPEDYIEEWRGLQDKLQGYVDATKAKADEAQKHIQGQADEIDTLKAQAMKDIAQDVTDVDNTAKTVKTTIAGYADDVEAAAANVTAAGEEAISQFNTNSQQAIDSFNTKGQAAVSQFNTNGTSAINQFDTNAGNKLDEVDGMITEAQGDVNAAITQLETATSQAVDAMEDALEGTTAGSLQNAINRALKLDVADMTNIPDNASLSSLTNVGSYCCKTASTAATVSDSPIDDSPFNMYVFSSATSGQVMQLVVPIDLNSKPTAEWHVRFGTSSAMDKWSVIGGGADIAAGLGIDVTGDAQKTVSLDTTAFYEHHEAANIIQGSTEVTGGGRFKELVVYGNTRQNLWVNPSGTQNGVTVTADKNGFITLSGTATNVAFVMLKSYILRPGSTYTFSVSAAVTGARGVYLDVYNDKNSSIQVIYVGGSKNSALSKTFTVNVNAAYVLFGIGIDSGQTVSGTYRVMLNEGSEVQPWCPPGLNGVDELSVVCAGKNLLARMGPSLPYTIAGITFSDNGDGGIRISGTATAAAYYNFFSVSPAQSLRITPGEYAASLIGGGSGLNLSVGYFDGELGAAYTSWLATNVPGVSSTGSIDRPVYLRPFLSVAKGNTVDTVVYPQLELGSTATAYEPPVVTTTPIDLDGHALNSLPDGTRDELRIDGTGAVTLVQRVGVATAPTTAGSWFWETAGDGIASFTLPARSTGTQTDMTELMRCDKLPVRKVTGEASYAMVDSTQGHAKNPAITSAAAAVTVAGGATYLYKLATPQEVDLPGVAMPDLASPDYTVFASSNVPAEIEAEVVKVDYLPPSDVYTKEEVDKKIEDAGMPDIVPVSKGGTGVTTAQAERNRLGLGNTTGPVPVANGGTGQTTAQAFRNAMGLGNTTGAVPVANGGTGVTSLQALRNAMGLGNTTGALLIANGGTGSTSAKAAQNSLLNDMTLSSEALTDSSMLVGYNISPSASNGAVHKRSALTIWNYVVGKIRSTFGFNSSNVLPVSHGGTGITANPSVLVNLESNSASNVLSSSPRPGVTGVLPVARGGTGVSDAAAERNRLSVYTKAEVDGKFLSVQSGTGNLPSSLPNNTLYIQYV